MLSTSRILDLIKSRGARGPVARACLKAALLAWKGARLVPIANRLRVTLPVAGQRMRVRAFSYDDLLTASPNYEPIVRELAPPAGATAVDAGAFIGRHTLDLARAVGPTGQVVAIEPQAESFALLEGNVRRNDLEQVTCVPCALGCDEREGWLRSERETSTAALLRKNVQPGRRDTRIHIRTLDDVLAKLGVERVDFLKLDVEGAERDVLAGAARTIEANPGMLILVEVHAVAAECPIRAWLVQHGFAITERWDGARRFYVARGPQGARPEIAGGYQNSVAAVGR